MKKPRAIFYSNVRNRRIRYVLGSVPDITTEAGERLRGSQMDGCADYAGKQINVHRKCHNRVLTILHETGHMALPDASEAAITELANAQHDALIRAQRAGWFDK